MRGERILVQEIGGTFLRFSMYVYFIACINRVQDHATLWVPTFNLNGCKHDGKWCFISNNLKKMFFRISTSAQKTDFYADMIIEIHQNYCI